MTEIQWGYFILGLAAYQVIKLTVTGILRAIIDHREKKFIKLVHATVPGKRHITFIALDSSDKRTMAKLERQLREKYDLVEDEDDYQDRGRPGDLRR